MGGGGGDVPATDHGWVSNSGGTLKHKSRSSLTEIQGTDIHHRAGDCGRPWPAAYINIIQNTHQIQVLTEALCRAQAIFYSLPNNEWGTKYRGLTYSAK